MLLRLTLPIVFFTSAFAAPWIEDRANDVCSNGIYGELAPILKEYSIALSLCSAAYPVQCTSGGVAKRAPASTTSTTISASDQNAQESAWSKCLQQAANTISTLCSCIETPKACTVAKSTPASTTSTTKPSTTSTTSKPSTSSSSTTSKPSTTSTTSESTSASPTSTTTSSRTSTSSTSSTTTYHTSSTSTTSTWTSSSSTTSRTSTQSSSSVSTSTSTSSRTTTSASSTTSTSSGHSTTSTTSVPTTSSTTSTSTTSSTPAAVATPSYIIAGYGCSYFDDGTTAADPQGSMTFNGGNFPFGINATGHILDGSNYVGALPGGSGSNMMFLQSPVASDNICNCAVSGGSLSCTCGDASGFYAISGGTLIIGASSGTKKRNNLWRRTSGASSVSVSASSSTPQPTTQYSTICSAVSTGYTTFGPGSTGTMIASACTYSPIKSTYTVTSPVVSSSCGSSTSLVQNDGATATVVYHSCSYTTVGTTTYTTLGNQKRWYP